MKFKECTKVGVVERETGTWNQRGQQHGERGALIQTVLGREMRGKKKGRKKERNGESGDVCLMGKSKKKGPGLRGWWEKKGKEKRKKKKMKRWWVVYVGGGGKKKKLII